MKNGKTPKPYHIIRCKGFTDAEIKEVNDFAEKTGLKHCYIYKEAILAFVRKTEFKAY